MKKRATCKAAAVSRMYERASWEEWATRHSDWVRDSFVDRHVCVRGERGGSSKSMGCGECVVSKGGKE